jgi:glucose-1-phosphate cytidylyltransferase
MKVVILAGGLGTRISEETHLKPKPMVEIGGMPILWHVMKIYSAYGLTDFIICCGYKGYIIKEYFSNYYNHNSDITIDLKNNHIKIHKKNVEAWTITLVDTGENTLTGGRLKRVSDYLEKNEDFCFTYGDGLADVDISALIAFHRQHGRLATLTSTLAPGRFGVLDIDADRVLSFKEKPATEGGRINGGFFVLSPKVLNYIEGDHISWEREPLECLANEGNLHAFRHDKFFQPMDTLREKTLLEDLWQTNRAPWKVW